MIRISALNEDSELEIHSEGEVTKEALEQIALREYAKALDLHRMGNISDATQLLKDLLDTEILFMIKKPAQGEKITGPLFNLKYLCYKNLASMLSTSGEIEGAIEAYCSAVELDDTDVTLWHRLGLLCLRGKRYEMALNAFQHGIELNPKHWPCLDKIVTLLLGLDYKEDCISTIYETLQLDPEYLRGLVYRRHVYLNYPYIRDFMEYLNPIYKWNEMDDDPIDEEQCRKLLKEAEDIHNSYLEQQRAEQFKYFLPNLKLKKPIKKLTWESVGESLIHMHHHMAENYYSHACRIEIVIEKEEDDEMMDVCEDNEQTNNDKSIKSLSDIDMLDKDKETIDTEKDTYVDGGVVGNEPGVENSLELKRKAPVRRKGGDLSFLKQWEWCNKRSSSRKKQVQENDSLEDNICSTLHNMVPVCLLPDQSNEENRENIVTLANIFEIHNNENREQGEQYFGMEKEHKDVELFISKYTEDKRDIIDILNNYLSILADKWRVKWPENLSKIFIEANKCYKNHIDVPSCTDENHQELLHYVTVNLLAEEFTVNEKLMKDKTTDEKHAHDSSGIESIGIALTLKPHILSGTDTLEFMLRYLWVKLHIHLLNKSEEIGLDCLYQLSCELEAMGEHSGTNVLEVVNFTFKPVINEDEISLCMKFLETNKKLSTVMDLYNSGSYEDVLHIIVDSFDYCKDMASKQNKVSLDFAVQLSLILDTFWALDNVHACFKWSFICLHEALNRYFRHTSGSSDYDKWTLTVVKILCCMEHIFTTEGVSCLETISQKDLSQGLEDLIRIIVHQVETNSSEMPFDNVIPWIILHYILQREEDQGRGRTATSKVTCDNVPNALMVLFIAHEQLGSRGWCCKSEGKLLYFILDTIVPRLRSPSLSKCLKNICQHMEQCVYCLFKHPERKTKLKYLVDHNTTAHTLNWMRAQQIYEILRPLTLPVVEGKLSAITPDTLQLFQRILELIPSECDPRKYVPDMEKYINGEEGKLPSIPPLLPYKMKDIYFLLGDYYFKKEDREMAIEFNILDVIVNNDRSESWAEISLAKALNLQRLLNSCENLNKEREVLTPAKSIIRCFEQSLKLDSTYCNLWIEYGIFTYTIHSFCSRLLKQASESLSMDDFEFLDKEKEYLLGATQKCFTAVIRYLNNSMDSENDNEDSWLPYYMLGKVAEKRNKAPSVYLNYYIQSLKSLEETNATYPLKINYNSPTYLCIEVLEIHYRIHASILKYIEQHEDKLIPMTLGKVFTTCIEGWKKSPFTKNLKKDETIQTQPEIKIQKAIHVADIKRPVSETDKDDYDLKNMELEAAIVSNQSKLSKSASSDIETLANKHLQTQNLSYATETTNIVKNVEVQTKQEPAATDLELKNIIEAKVINKRYLSTDKSRDKVDLEKKDESLVSISSSSSNSSSSESSDNNDDSSGQDSDTSQKSNDFETLPQEEIIKIASACLEALEDCSSRFPPHYKAIYRLVHYHFYYKSGKDIKKCKDLMLTIFTSSSGQKLGGLFSDRKNFNFFNNIWKIPSSEVDRAGSFSFHMNRSVLLAMEILKETDDHITLLDLSLYLQKIPEPDKKYLRDSDRVELAQQALYLCSQSFKSQLIRFSQQENLKSNEVIKEMLNTLILDIYKAYQKTQKQRNSKQFINLLIDAYKLVTTVPVTDNMNLVDISMKYCQARKISLKKQTVINAETVNATTSLDTSLKPETKKSSVSTSKLLKTQEQSMTFQSNLSKLNEQELVRQTTSSAALPLWINLRTIADFSQANLQAIKGNISKLQCPPQKQLQTQFSHNFMGQSLSSSNIPPPKKQKHGPKISNVTKSAPVTKTSQLKPSKSFGSSKAPTCVVTNLQKSSSTPLAPSMGTVLSSLPPSMATNLAALGTSVHTSRSHLNDHSLLPAKTHISSTSTVNAAVHAKPPLMHQQITCKKKLAERQKILPSTSNNWNNINASIGKLPSSLTITKTSSATKQSGPRLKENTTKKSHPVISDRGVAKTKQTSSNEVIVLDD